MRVKLSQIHPIESRPWMSKFCGDHYHQDLEHIVGDCTVNDLILAMLEGKLVPPIKICLSREFHQVKNSQGKEFGGYAETNKKYTIVNGHHRFAAAWMLGLETIPVEICKFMFSRNKKGERYL